VTVAEHPFDDLNGDWALTRVVHEGRTPARGAGGGEPPQVYENRFECVPAAVPYRPRRPRRAVRQVTETATVVGPEGKEIHTDEHGRVKVQFHWDLEGPGDAGRSCWIRVAQAWAGAGWGFQIIPRVGMEVLVTFLGGDPDRPVITGCLFNAVNPPTFGLPRAATRSGIRTRSVPGKDRTGFNEISFEDTAGEEELFLHAERDLVEMVEHDHKVVVGRRDAESPAGRQSIEVGDRRTVSVGGSHVVNVGGDHQETVQGERTEQVVGGATLRVEGVHEQWDGASFVHHVAGEHRVTVGGELESNVAASARVTTGGDHQTVTGGNHRVDVRGTFTLSAGELGLVNAGLGLTLASTTSVRLVCGHSTIELGPEEITLSSPSVTLLGGKMVSAHVEGAEAVVEKNKVHAAAKSVKLSSAEAELSLTSDGFSGASKKEVALHGKGANVILGDEAEVNGSKVKLKSGSQVSGEYDEPQPVEASFIDISLTRPVPKDGDPTQVDHQGVAGARYVVEASDGRLFQGVLDAQGKARVPIPKGQAKVTFVDYDAGALKVK
jgi:type VI secretion system secreted protein VgrG